MKSLFVLAIILLASFASGYKILGVFPLGSASHYAIGESTLKALAEAGHEVTMISVMKTKKPMPNFREVIIEDSTKKALAGLQN
jgi:predicted CoA-binding protein